MDETNQTEIWLNVAGKGHLATAANSGRITMMTAFVSALDPRPLDERLADWDRRRGEASRNRGSAITPAAIRNRGTA